MTAPAGRPQERGRLKAKSGADVSFHYNPAEMTISKSSDWKATPTKGAKSGVKAEFTGTNPREIKMQLHLEAFAADDHARDVAKDVDQLFAWTNPTDKALDKNKAHPETLNLIWGKQYFDCYLKSVSAKFTLFDGEGRPLRAKVDISLGESPTSASAQNPTSGGVGGRRQHLVVAGDTLQSVSTAEYGRPTLWRALALANNVDDPLRLRAGRLLLVPSQAEAEGLG